MNTTQESLLSHVQHIADCLGNPAMFDCEWEDGEPSAYEYLQDALDIEYIIGSDGNYRGARVLVAFGGPNIWIDTKREVVEGAWWSDHDTVGYTDSLGLDDALRDLWDCR